MCSKAYSLSIKLLHIIKVNNYLALKKYEQYVFVLIQGTKCETFLIPNKEDVVHIHIVKGRATCLVVQSYPNL